MAVLPGGDTGRVEAETPARVMLIGGEPLDGPRFIWWNFVSSRRERITEAASEWSAHQTPRIEGEKDWVPLPISPPLPPSLFTKHVRSLWIPCGFSNCVLRVQ